LNADQKERRVKEDVGGELAMVVAMAELCIVEI
jgi:hypothetical protein